MISSTAEAICSDEEEPVWEEPHPVRVTCRDSVTLVHIDSYEKRIPCGEFLNLSYREKLSFRGLDQMMMEDILDTIAIPRTSYEHRNLFGQAHVFEKIDRSCCLETLERRAPEEFPYIKATFTVRCSYRHHGSMQGELLLAGKRKGRRVYFRSGLELMRLIYEFLD